VDRLDGRVWARDGQDDDADEESRRRMDRRCFIGDEERDYNS